jgi:ribonuclease BN (tRNA processing enzyme)
MPRISVIVAIALCVVAGPASAGDGDGTRLILLGTAGGPAVKKLRAQPANAVVVAGDVYIVDAGDGVSRQMALAGLSLRDLRAIFITHNHSDHVADYGTLLLRAMSSGLKEPVQAFGPPPLAQMTESYFDYMRWDIELRVRNEDRPTLASLVNVHEIAGPGIVYEDDNVSVRAVEVPHGAARPSYAYRFDTRDLSIVFSGDTSRSEALIGLAKGAAILVHEVLNIDAIDATVNRTDPGNEALRRHIIEAHTTMREVGEVATEAGVAKLVLSHFVPSDIPAYDRPEIWLSGVRESFDGEIVVGEDLMEIR